MIVLAFGVILKDYCRCEAQAIWRLTRDLLVQISCFITRGFISAAGTIHEIKASICIYIYIDIHTYTHTYTDIHISTDPFNRVEESGNRLAPYVVFEEFCAFRKQSSMEPFAGRRFFQRLHLKEKHDFRTLSL